MIKLNFGSAHDRISGFKNVDALDWDGNTDIVWDMNQVPYSFLDTNSVDEIRSVETLEHISFRNTMKVLQEWYRILMPGGKLHIQVPACDKMCEMFAKGEVCDCVLHKPQNDEDTKGKKGCLKCGGKGKVNPTRWMFAFTGAGKHEFDFHLAIFTKDILKQLLQSVGFVGIQINYDKYEWKIKVNCFKPIK